MTVSTHNDKSGNAGRLRMFALAASLTAVLYTGGALTQDASSPAGGTTNPTKKNGAKAPRKKVVLEGGTTEADLDISPSLTSAEAERLREITRSLVAQSEVDLQKLATKPLNSDQQETVVQVRSFLAQSKAASDEKDWGRAHHLALKAQLLADDLVRH